MALMYLGSMEVPSPALRYLLYTSILLALVVVTMRTAYGFSCAGLSHYGYMLHGETPWFNFRATQYMSDHGWEAFLHWFDDKSWYPLGRPVGSTTYPGLQITAVVVHHALNHMGVQISLNNVCVMLPVWCGLAGIVFIGPLAFEVSGSLASAAASMMFLASVPMYIICSLAGEFDAVCLATPLMLLTFYLWVRSLRCPRSWPIGVLAGLAYGYMAVTWVGSVFALNVVAAHAFLSGLADLVKHRRSSALLRAYALFYVVGTAVATRVPAVGMAPFKSLEQLSALVVLVLLTGFWFADWASTSCARRVAAGSDTEATGAVSARKGKAQSAHGEAGAAPAAVSEETTTSAPSDGVTPRRVASFRVMLTCGACVGLFFLIQGAIRAGVVDAPSPRLRAALPRLLGGRSFADSARSSRTTRSPLHVLRDSEFNGDVEAVWSAVLTPYFLWLTYMTVTATQLTTRLEKPTKTFAPLLSAAALFIGMSVRGAMPLVAAVAALAAGLASGWAYDESVSAAFWDPAELPQEAARISEERAAYEEQMKALPARQRNAWRHIKARFSLDMRLMKAENPFVALFTFSGPFIIILASLFMTGFRSGGLSTAFPFIHPGITFHTVENGELVRVEDYYDGYAWLGNHTPHDARVLAWHTHGFHVNVLANRTTLVDGNTWNAEQLALVAKVFAAPVAEAHELVRHLADYILIWAGNDGPKDIYQLPLMAMTANALFKDVCAGDPMCLYFSFTDDEMTRPRPLLKQSLLYTLHQHMRDKRKPITVDPELFEEVYTSPRGLVRVFRVLNVSESSKAWMADPAHRLCGAAPDEWICPGQYPPAEPLERLWHLADGGFQYVEAEDLPRTYPKRTSVDGMDE